MLARAAAGYAANLSSSASAEEWLAARLPAPVQGAGGEEMLGLVGENPHGHPVGAISIPYRNVHGDIWNIRFRKLTGEPKYLSITGARTGMYGHDQIMGASVVHVCEGELDAVVLQRLGHLAVAFPGVNAATPAHARLLRGRGALIWGDGDEAGRGFARRFQQWCPDGRIVPVPDGHDVTTLWQAGQLHPLLRAAT